MRIRNRSPLAVKIFIMFTFVVTLLFFCSGLMLYTYFSNNIEGSLKETLALVIEINTESFTDLFSRLNTAIEILSGNESQFVKLLYNYEGNDLYAGKSQYEQARSLLRDSLTTSIGQSGAYYNAMMLLNEDIALSRILPAGFNWAQLESVSIYRAVNVDKEDWYGKTVEQKGDSYWFKNESKPSCLYVSQLLNNQVYLDRKITNYTLGVLLVELDISWIEARINTSRLTEQTLIILADYNDQVIYSNRATSQELDVNTMFTYLDETVPADNNEMQLVYYEGSGYWLSKKSVNNLTLFTLIPAADISRHVGKITGITVFVSIAGACVGVVLVTLITFYVVRPIQRLSAHMKNNDILSPISHVKIPNDEVGDLYLRFNELALRTRESTQQQIHSEMRVLMARMNPHFLYNTLDTVCHMALLCGNNEIADALSSLAIFTRHNISDPDEMVTLYDELEVIEHYINIYKLRLCEKLSVSFDYQIDTITCRIPKLVIQPLIENAILHNAQLMQIDILVQVYIEAKILHIAVADNGSTADAETINWFLEGADTLQCKSGYGIRNVNSRLRMKYGDEYGLSYHNKEPFGLCAVVAIPLRANHIEKSVIAQ